MEEDLRQVAIPFTKRREDQEVGLIGIRDKAVTEEHHLIVARLSETESPLIRCTLGAGRALSLLLFLLSGREELGVEFVPTRGVLEVVRSESWPPRRGSGAVHLHTRVPIVREKDALHKD